MMNTIHVVLYNVFKNNYNQLLDFRVRFCKCVSTDLIQKKKYIITFIQNIIF